MEKYEWYVLHVRTDSELDIAKALESRGFSTAVPIENRIIRKSGKWIKKAYIVFAGYVFVFMRYSWAKYYAMNNISGIIKILGGGQNPIPLSESESEFVLKLSDLLSEPSVLKFNDDSYKVVSGFLTDYADKIVKKLNADTRKQQSRLLLPERKRNKSIFYRRYRTNAGADSGLIRLRLMNGCYTLSTDNIKVSGWRSLHKTVFKLILSTL